MAEIFPLEGMGETAENLVERHDISREDQDRFALNSHLKALSAIESGAFHEEITSISVPRRKQDPLVFSQDEGPRAGSSMEALAKLRPAFRTGGTGPQEIAQH